MTQLIGISGGSCSGKTTLAEALVTELGAEEVSLLSFDDYFRGFDVLQRLGVVDWEEPNLYHYNL